MLKKIRNLVFTYIVKIFYLIFSKTPYYINFVCSRVLGYLFYCFDFRYKYKAFKNIKYVFQNINYKSVIRITKQCYLNLSQNLMEFFLLPFSRKLYKKVVDFPKEDKDILKKLYNKNKGVILFSAHFSNWELLGCSLVIENFPVAVIARDFYIPEINKIIYKIRSTIGEKVISRGGQTSVKELLKAIKNRCVIGVLIDQNIKNVKNIEIPFLGHVSPTPVSFFEIAIKYQIPAAVGLIYRFATMKYRIRIVPIENSVYENKEKFATYVNNIISEYIIKYPEQWTWMHNRWIN